MRQVLGGRRAEINYGHLDHLALGSASENEGTEREGVQENLSAEIWEGKGPGGGRIDWPGLGGGLTDARAGAQLELRNISYKIIAKVS